MDLIKVYLLEVHLKLVSLILEVLQVLLQPVDLKIEDLLEVFLIQVHLLEIYLIQANPLEVYLIKAHLMQEDLIR